MTDLASFDARSPGAVAELLRERGIRPDKALGQNFLVDRNVLLRIVEAAELQTGDEVLEIGAGLGALTETLLATGARVTAVEKDPALQPILHERFAQNPSFSLVCGDALGMDFSEFFAPPRSAKLVSNLPYSVGTRIAVDAALGLTPPNSMTLLLQKEVCRRFAAWPGDPDRGAVSVLLQRLYDVKIVRDVPPGCFLPRPEVVSSVVTLRRHERHPLSPGESADFNAFVKTAFLHRRKQLKSALRGHGALSDDAIINAFEIAGVSPTARAETLSLDNWIRLSRAFRDGRK